MTDAFRQDATTKLHDAVKPDAQKTWTERKGDQISGNVDKLASHGQTEQSKSGTQKIVDAVTPGNSSHVTHDTGRRGPVDQIQAALTPDSHKSTGTRAHDSLLGSGNNAAAALQPESTKSTGQKITDTLNPNSHSHPVEDHTRRDASDTLGAKLKPDALKSEREYQSDAVKGQADKSAAVHTDEHHKSIGQKIKDAVLHPSELLHKNKTHDHSATGHSSTHHGSSI